MIRIEPEREAELFLNQGNADLAERIQMPAAFDGRRDGSGLAWVAVLDTGRVGRTHKGF